MRPALAIVNNFEAKKMQRQSPGSPSSPRLARPATPGSPTTPRTEDKNLVMSAINAAKLATEKKAWTSAVRKLINAQQSIFLSRNED